MCSCWNLEFSDRPSFTKVVTGLSASLEAMSGYMDMGKLANCKIDASVSKREESQNGSMLETHEETT